MRPLFSLLTLAGLSLALSLPVEGQRGQDGRGGGGARVSPEQILGILAFNDALNVSDEQLLQARAALKESHTEQQEMFQAMRDGEIERDEIREKMMAMRGKILTQVSAILDEEQVEALKKHMASQRGGFGRRVGRGGPGGGGGPGAPDTSTDTD